MTLSAGSKLGPYEIVAPLGAGGMGEVYRARDTRLKRDVAIKVLPASFSADADRLRRFEQEAQAAGALNHPNVLAIHDLGTHDAAPYIVSELLEGETLRSLLAGEPFPPRRAIALSLQIASGLAAAHEKGIVHRDLKPENLFVTRDNRVKILDFGLAKLTQNAGGGVHSNLPTATAGTEPGAVLGTLGYMAPEQLRGKAADHRADLFSFGAILYEMLSGKRAFHGESAADTISAILNKEPPDLSETNRRVAPGLERIVRHCLEKNPEARFQSASDIAFALESFSDTAVSGAAAAQPSRPARGIGSRLRVPLALLLGAALGAAAVFLLARPKVVEAPRVSLLTYSGRDSQPSVSPDGSVVAFVSDRDGRSRIWLKQLAGGEEVALTSGVDSGPRFSPDGGSILYARMEEGMPSLFRVGTVGRDPRKVLENAWEGDWSRDASAIAFIRLAGLEWQLGVAAADGSGERILGTSRVPLKLPRWSPDGSEIAVIRVYGFVTGVADQVLLYGAAGGQPRVLPTGATTGTIYGVSWNGDGRRLLLAQTTSASASTGSRILFLNVSDGGVLELVRLANEMGGAELLGDGRLLLDSSQLRQSLREFRIANGVPVEGRWLTHGSTIDRQPVYSRDASWVFFSSQRSGNLDLWAVSTESGTVRRLTDHAGEDFDPGFLLPGGGLLWSSNRGGNFEVWSAEADGRNARQVSRDGEDAENPTSTPDGAWIVYASAAGKNQGIWRVRPDGKDATRLTNDIGIHPEVSPDGSYIGYHTLQNSGEIRVIRLDDGTPACPPTPISTLRLARVYPFSDPFSLGRLRWTPDGRGFVYVGLAPDGRVGLFRQDFEAGRDTSATSRPFLLLDEDQVPESFGISRDGARITVSILERQSNLVTVDGITGARRPAPSRPR